jgi:hypothetical protein
VRCAKGRWRGRRLRCRGQRAKASRRPEAACTRAWT